MLAHIISCHVMSYYLILSSHLILHHHHIHYSLVYRTAEQQQQLGELSALMGEEEMEMMPRRVQPTPTGFINPNLTPI